MNVRHKLLVAIVLLGSSSLNAQTTMTSDSTKSAPATKTETTSTTTASPSKLNDSANEDTDSLSIAGYFEQLYKKSNRYQEYKVIKIAGYQKLESLVKDSLNEYKSDISEQNKTIAELNEQVNKLKQNNFKLQNDLTNLEKARNKISFLGLQLTKSTYNLVIWIIIIVLLLLAIILFSIYQNGHKVVKSTKIRLEEIQEEFDQHRKNALVKEQKLARELMDVKLKQKHL